MEILEKRWCNRSFRRRWFSFVSGKLLRTSLAPEKHSKFIRNLCARHIWILRRFSMNLEFILGPFFVFAWERPAKTFGFEAVLSLGWCFGGFQVFPRVDFWRILVAPCGHSAARCSLLGGYFRSLQVAPKIESLRFWVAYEVVFKSVWCLQACPRNMISNRALSFIFCSFVLRGVFCQFGKRIYGRSLELMAALK